MTTAVEAVTGEYLAQYEYHCEREQLERAGDPPLVICAHAEPTPEVRAEDHHRAALLLLWCYDAERMNPKPPGLP